MYPRLMRRPAGPFARCWRVGLLGLGLMPVTPSPIADAFESRLDDVRIQVIRKESEIPAGVPSSSADRRVLGKVLRLLEKPRESLMADLGVAARVFRMLERRFPGDSPLADAIADSASSLHEDVMEERTALIAWTGRTGSERNEARLERGIGRMGRWLDRADGQATRYRHNLTLRRGIRVVRKTRRSLGLDSPRTGPLPLVGVAPDIPLFDVNPSSQTAGEEISAGSMAGNITAWAFLRST